MLKGMVCEIGLMFRILKRKKRRWRKERDTKTQSSRLKRSKAAVDTQALKIKNRNETGKPTWGQLRTFQIFLRILLENKALKIIYRKNSDTGKFDLRDVDSRERVHFSNSDSSDEEIIDWAEDPLDQTGNFTCPVFEVNGFSFKKSVNVFWKRHFRTNCES